MKRLYKALRFTRYGTGSNRAHRMGRFRSFATLKAALRGCRLDLAELEADGLKQPLDFAIRYEHLNRAGEFVDSETVALWKRGRFVWVDPIFKKRERGS